MAQPFERFDILQDELQQGSDTKIGTQSMVDRAVIFANILARNDLRRTAHLPLLDVRRTYEVEVARALWAEHVRDHHEIVRAEVLRVEREKRGLAFPESGGGWWIVAAQVRATLTEDFRGRVPDLIVKQRGLEAEFLSP